MLVIVINCLRLLVVVIYCYHGDSSDGRHVCRKYYQATMLVIVLRLFAVVILLLPWRWAACVYKVKRPYAVFSGYYVINCQ